MTKKMQQHLDRKALLNFLIRIRRAIKCQMQRQMNVDSDLHRLCRRKRLVEAQENLFNHHRIAEMEKRITSLRKALATGREVHAQYGQILRIVAPFVDQLLSFHDKCQVLGIGHVTASRALDGDTATQFEEMMFCHVLEYRGNAESYPLLDISMPFFIATFERIMQRQATTEEFKGLFPALTTYQQITNSDGTTAAFVKIHQN